MSTLSVSWWLKHRCVLALCWIGKAQWLIHIHSAGDKSWLQRAGIMKTESYTTVIMNWQDLLCYSAAINPNGNLWVQSDQNASPLPQITTTTLQIMVVVSANMRWESLLKTCRLTAGSTDVCGLTKVHIWPSWHRHLLTVLLKLPRWAHCDILNVSWNDCQRDSM